MEVDDIIKRLAWAAKLYGGSRRNRECDQGSRARDWEWSDGISDIEGQTARVAASELGNERVSNRGPRRGDCGKLGSTGYQPVGFGCQPKRTLIEIAVRFCRIIGRL